MCYNQVMAKKRYVAHVALNEQQDYSMRSMCAELGLTRSELLRKALDRMILSRARAAASLRTLGMSFEQIQEIFSSKLDGIVITKDPY